MFAPEIFGVKKSWLIKTLLNKIKLNSNIVLSPKQILDPL